MTRDTGEDYETGSDCSTESEGVHVGKDILDRHPNEYGLTAQTEYTLEDAQGRVLAAVAWLGR